MTLVAGTLPLDAVMRQLAAERPVFHSEHDFQHAFAQVVHHLDRSLELRLEVPQGNREHVDLRCFGPQGRTAIEFKYFTSAWQGVDPTTGEEFRLRAHAAADLARLYFVTDLVRLEMLCQDDPLTDGIAVLLTNHAGLWSEPPSRRRLTNDREFRLHDGRTLRGTLQWAGGSYGSNERTLVGRYVTRWIEYSELEGSNGKFRWLAVKVPPQSG
jgi:hypothetical protein